MTKPQQLRDRRNSKAKIARDAGLEPLAHFLLKNPGENPEQIATTYLSETIQEVDIALEGAKQILIENFFEDASLLHLLKEHLWENALLFSTIIQGKEKQGKNLRAYFAYKTPLKKTSTHDTLMLLRGRRENILRFSLQFPNENGCEALMTQHLGISNQENSWVLDIIRITLKNKILPKLEQELIIRFREKAEENMMPVLTKNLRDLLSSPSIKNQTILGLDTSGYFGVKVAVVDGKGSVLDTTILFPHSPQNNWYPSIAELAKLAIKYRVRHLCLSTGSTFHDTSRLIAELIKMYPDLNLKKTIISQAGASVYAKSNYAEKELSDIEPLLRGAVFIARRLQNPLAEFVKIAPEAIYVNQYQQEISPAKLHQWFNEIITDSINKSGANINTASVAILQKISGLNETLAQAIVEYRESNGAFKSLENLKHLSGFTEDIFEQCKSFLRTTEDKTHPIPTKNKKPEKPAINSAMADALSKLFV